MSRLDSRRVSTRDAVTTGRPRISAGQSHSSEMPTSEPARPRSPTISVALGSREQIRIAGLWPRRGDRLRGEDLPQHAQRRRPGALDHRLEAAQLEPRELDEALRTHGHEAEVGKEVAREDRPVDEEALVDRLALRVAIAKRLESPRLLVARVADRGQEERLQDPGRAPADEVGAGDEHSVGRGWAAGELRRTRKELGRRVLHHPEQAAVVVVVQGSPRAPRLGALAPAILLDVAAGARLPPDTVLADGGGRSEGRACQACNARRHGQLPSISSTMTSTAAG